MVPAWVVFGIVAAFIVQLGALLPTALYPSLTPPALQATPYDLPGATSVTIGFFLIPLTIGIAILRYRLWDIDILINRTLVYGALTACVVSLYVLVVGVLGAVVQAQGNILIAVLATGLVAILFQPLRDRLQQVVNRLMYGDRDDPYAVLSSLGQRLEATLAPDAVLPTIVETIREALKLRYVAIALTTNDQRPTTNHERPMIEDEAAAFSVHRSSSALHSSPSTGVEVVASSGEAPVSSSLDHLVIVSLIHQGETIGQLLLAPRAVDEAIALAATLQPDVILMDIKMPGVNGIRATREILHTSPHISILVVSMLEDNDSVFAAMRAGARGYVLKGVNQAEILRAIRAVANGEAIFGPGIAQRLIGFFAAARPTVPPRIFPELTEREGEVLALLAQGRSNVEIAEQLSLSLKTVRNHVSNIFSKLQVADRAQAVIRAREAGLGHMDRERGAE